MVYAQPRIFLGESDEQSPQGFLHTNGSANLGQSTEPYNNQPKIRTCRIVDFAVSADHRIKLKESEKKDKYMDLAKKLKKIVELESDDCTNCNSSSSYSHRMNG